MSPALPTTADGARARAVTGTARVISGVLVSLGLLGVLNTGVDDLGEDSAQALFVFEVHPLTAIAWMVIGVVGVAMAVGPDRAQRFLLVVGPLLVAWALLALAVGDGATQVLTRDAPVGALHLIAGAVAIVAAAVPLPGPLARVLAPPPVEPGAR